MKRRVLAVVVLVVVIVFAANMIVFAVPSEALPFAITFEPGEPDVGSRTVTYQVVLTRFAGSGATASLIDLHLAVTGGYDIATDFTAMNESGVMVVKQDEETNTLRLYRLDMAHPLQFTDNSIVLGTLTLSADVNGTVGLAHDANFSTGDYVASDGVTSPGYQDSLLASVGTASYTFPQGVTVSGTVMSYNPNNVTTIKLMQGTTEKYTATIAAETGSGQATQDFSISSVAAGTYDLVVTKPGHLTYTVTGVVVGSADLDLTAAIGKEYSTMTMLAGDVNGDGYITSSDVNIVRSNLNYNKSTVNEPRVENPLTDINGDEYTTSSDVNVIRSSINYNKGAIDDSTFAYIVP